MWNKARHTFWLAYLPTLLVLGAVTYLSLASGSGLPRHTLLFPHEDKLIHATMYFGLSMVMACGMQWRNKPAKMLVIMSFIIPALYGGLMELVQPYFPPRTCELADFIADAVGSMLGVLLVYLLWTRRCCTK